MEYIGIIASSIFWMIILYTSYHLLLKKKKNKNDRIPYTGKKEKVEYTIKVKYDDYGFYIYKNGSCIGYKRTLEKAKEVIERNINNPKEEEVEVYTKNY